MLLEWVILIFLSYRTIRAVLIVAGLYKQPILERFENYGDERIFSPLLGVIFWGVAFMFYFLIVIMRFDILILLLLILSLPFVIFHERIIHMVRDYPQVFMMYPRWYRSLIDHTSREERRRIAYLWLRLPYRTRLLYNTRDEYFQHWVDLVLMTIA